MDRTEARQIARKVIRAARRRAPSFVMLNMIASIELDSYELSDEDRQLVVREARRIIECEKH